MNIFVQKINYLNILLIFFFRIFFKKVYFFKASKYLKNKVFFRYLEKINIFWVNYEKRQIDDYTKIKRKKIIFASDLKKKLEIILWTNNLRKNNLSKEQFGMIINNYLQNHTEEYFEYIKFAEDLVGREEKKIFFFCNYNYITKTIFKSSKYRNINIFDLTIIYFIILKIHKKILKIFLKKQDIVKEKNTRYFEKIEDHKVIFFNQGVDLEHTLLNYLNSKVKKPTKTDNILHIEWDINKISDASKKYYKDNNISVIGWNEIKFSHSYKNLLNYKNIIFFFFKSIFKCGIYLSFYLTLEFIKVLISSSKIDKLKKAEIILVAYEFLFPTHIHIACRNLNKKIFTLRERMLQENQGFESDYDKYFSTYTGMSKKNIYIGNIKLRNYEKNEYKYLEEKKKNQSIPLTCLVLVDHTNPNWYLNGRNQVANCKVNISFLEEVLSTSKRKKGILFMIKCKNPEWESIDKFKNLIKEINSIKNIKILKRNLWPDQKCLSYCDLAIGNYTSFMDHMVFLNKPVIIYNSDCFPMQYLNLNRDIFAQNPKELNDKFDEIIYDKSKYLKKMNLWKKQLDLKFSQDDFEKKLSINL